MTDDKLTRGLEARERARKGGQHPLTAAKGAPVTMKALTALARSAQMKRKRHAEYANAVTTHMTKWRHNREAVLASLPEKTRADLIAAEEPRERAMALDIYREERDQVSKAVYSAHVLARSTARLFSDPVAYLDTQTLGNEKRSVYDRQLSNAGAAALADALLKAAATGDAYLFAAANAKAGTLPKAQKELLGSRIDVRGTAALLAADDLRQCGGALSAIAYFAEAVAHESKLLEGKTVAPNEKINVGMLKRDAEAIGAEFLKDTEPEPAPFNDPAFAGAPRGTFSP